MDPNGMIRILTTDTVVSIRILTTDSVVSIQMSSSSAARSAVGILVRPVARAAMTTKCLLEFLSERCVNKSGN